MAGTPSSTLLLDIATHDLVLDSNNNIAVAAPPYALAQDAASAIMTFLGEVFWDVTIGVPWKQQILGQRPSLQLLKAQLVTAAETVPGVASAVVYISSFSNRGVSGQVQVSEQSTGQVSVASFSVLNPQGGG